jgi:hypothetical protein
MFNSIIFVTEFIWYNIIRDTLLMFEQFLYVTLLSGIVPGSFYFMDWILNWLNGLSITCYINIVQNVYVDIKWNQPRQEKNLVGNVYGKNVVMKPIKHLMVLYIGWKKVENN